MANGQRIEDAGGELRNAIDHSDNIDFLITKLPKFSGQSVSCQQGLAFHLTGDD